MITYFGVHIDAMLQAWFGEIFVPELRHKYGNDTEVAALVLVDTPWLSPEVQLEKMEARHLLLSSDNERVTGDEGLLENVRRKLSFVLRTEMPSSFARQRPDLVEPGDFPWAGAGTYKGYTGGVSGLNEESDWWAYERIIDQLIKLRAEAAQAAIAASKERVEGWRYLEGEGKPPERKILTN